MLPFFEAAMIAATGGVLCWFIQAAPLVEPTFKRVATYLLIAGTTWAVLAHLGVLAQMRQLVG